MNLSSKKLKCWHAVEKAIKDGALVRPPRCERCGKTPKLKIPLTAHHDDYNKPLEVKWLCKQCHMKEHATSEKKDNSTLRLKKLIRRNLLKEIKNPVIMETHGGAGEIYKHCYSDFLGVVFEKDSRKAAILGEQRPEWFVYECDCKLAISAGAGKNLGVNFVDFDPYGDPWPIIDVFFECGHYRPKRLCIAVNDGLRQKLKTGSGWNVSSMKASAKKYGNEYLYPNYLDLCQKLMKEKAAKAGYILGRWAGYYCGYHDQMTHYAAVLDR